MGSSLLVRLFMPSDFMLYVSRTVQGSFNRKGPPVVKLIDRKVDAATLAPLPLLHIDDKTIASHRSDLHRGDTGVPGAIQNLIGHLRFHRKDHP